MKKIVLLLTAVITLAVHTKAQKSGILKKDNYGAFTGDDWEDFLAGRRAADFEKKSNVKLDEYLNKAVDPFVKDHLKETSISSAVANSTVVDFPAGSDVYTMATDGSWITRKVYPGERGFKHTQTGMYWLSFSCGNLCGSYFNKVVTPGTYVGGGNQQPLANGSNTAGNTININTTPGNQTISAADGLLFKDGIKIFAQGANFYADAQENTVSLLRKNPLGCCGGGSSTVAASTVSYAQPTLYAQPAVAPAQQTISYQVAPPKVPFGQTWFGQMTATAVGGLVEDGVENLFSRRSNQQYIQSYPNTWSNGYYGNNASVNNFQLPNQMFNQLPGLQYSTGATTNYSSSVGYPSGSNTWVVPTNIVNPAVYATPRIE